MEDIGKYNCVIRGTCTSGFIPKKRKEETNRNLCSFQANVIVLLMTYGLMNKNIPKPGQFVSFVVFHTTRSPNFAMHGEHCQNVT